MELRAATVTQVSPFRVKFDTDNGAESLKTHKKPKWYTPVLNDRVYFLYSETDKQYVCLGAYV